MRKFLISLFGGIAVTLMLVGAAFLADSAGYSRLASGLFWQNSLLQNLVPAFNMSTPERPLYEGTPLSFLAFLISIPIGFVVYGFVVYAALGSLRRGT
jgi:hypothetical protein